MEFTSKIGKLVINLIFIFLCALVVIPMILMVSASISQERDLIINGYSLLPRIVDFEAYGFLFGNPKTIIRAYGVTLLVSLATTFWHMFCQTMLAYPLSRRDFEKRGLFAKLLLITMLFSGGLVPQYLLNTRYLHMQDTIWIYIFPGAVSAWNVFLLKSCYKDVSEEMSEAARIDGASDFRILYTMIIPLTKPVIASLSFGTFMNNWNSWMTSMLYINKRTDLYTIQYLLQRTLSNIEVLEMNTAYTAGYIPTETIKMAMAVIVAIPVLFIFPFFQKYFQKGMTMGSVKG